MGAARVFGVVFGLCFIVSVAHGELPKSKFEYKFSFKGPHLVQRDKSVPFWESGGDAMPGDDMIRVTPSLRSQKGRVWTKNQFTSENWQLDVAVRVQGRGRVGADGMAIWYTAAKGVDGPVFGSNDLWNGLGVFLDSFDNDAKHNNPYISAMVNDGTKPFNHQQDGMTQQLGGCLRDFRNKPWPVRVRIEYYKRSLTISVNNGMTQSKDNFELCMRQENVILPASGYFGVTAATGGLADDHDVLSFLTHSLIAPLAGQGGEVSEEERKKFEKEFEDYYKELERAKEDFQKQHPDKAKQDPYAISDDKWFEGQSERELKQIFDGQTSIHYTLKDLNRKLEELLGRQELILSKVSSMPVGQGQVPQGQPQGQAQQGQQMIVDTIRRHEVDRVLNNQNDVIQQVREMRSIINDVQQKANLIYSSGSQQGGGGAAVGSQLVLHELKDNLNNARNDIAQLLSRPQAASAQCPPPPPQSCLSPVVFFLTVAAQIVLMIGYMTYRQSKEAQAKKFY